LFKFVHETLQSNGSVGYLQNSDKSMLLSVSNHRILQQNDRIAG